MMQTDSTVDPADGTVSPAASLPPRGTSKQRPRYFRCLWLAAVLLVCGLGWVGSAAAQTGDEVWMEDAVPAGASLGSDESNGWSWTGSDPTPYAGSLASPSSITAGEHQHYFYGAASTLSVPSGSTLFVYVYLDPANPPSEVMLQWNDGNWEHRAYWGANNIGWGGDGTVSRRYVGPLPAVGGWARLEVPAASVGLEGSTLNGLAFTLCDGRATWDHAGVSTTPTAPLAPNPLQATTGDGSVTLSWAASVGASGYSVYRATASGGPFVAVAAGITVTTYVDAGLADGQAYYYYVTTTNAVGESGPSNEVAAVPEPPIETVWVEDAAPAGATLAADSNDGWDWVGSDPPPYSGSLADESSIAGGEHQHYFYNATATLYLPIGGKLFSYIYLDPANPPSEVMLQWNDGSWEHRAYWGADNIGWGSDGTASRYYVGPLPAVGGWARLEVPAANVGLAGSTLNGLAYTLADGRATWDHTGVSVTPSISSPPQLIATGANGNIRLTWSDPAEAITGYNVYRSSVSGGPYTLIASDLTNPSYIDTNVTNRATYYYVVTAVDSLGESAYSNEAASGTFTLWIAGTGDGSVALSWSSIPGADGYVVYRSTVSGGPYQRLNYYLVGGTSFTDNNNGFSLNNGTTYYYVVQAANNGGLGPNSVELPVTLGLAAPSPVTAAPGDGAVTLSWPSVPGADGYVVYRSTVSGGPYQRLNYYLVGTSFTDNNNGFSLNNGMTYYYVVQAANNGGGGPYSNELPFTPTLAAPDNLQVTSGSSNIALSWSSVPGADGYVVYRSTVSGGPYQRLNYYLMNGTSYTDGGLQNNEPYYYVVRAGNSGGVGAASNEATGVVAPELATAGAALALSPNPVVGGAGATGLIVLSAPAPAGGEAFALAGSGPAASVPASVAVAAGDTSATFPITTSIVEASTTVTITATPTSGQAVSATLTLLPEFTVVPNAAALTLTPGAGTSSTIEINSPGGYAGPVSLSLSGLPTGLTAWFYPPTALLAAPLPGASLSGISSTLFFSYPAGVTVPSGPYTLTVTGTSGAFTASAPLTLTIP